MRRGRPTVIGARLVLAVVSLGTLLQGQGNLFISLLATGLIAVLFQPLRLRLQRAVNRLMYGERDTPYTVISRLGQRLEATLAPEAVLPTIVETVAQADILRAMGCDTVQGFIFARPMFEDEFRRWTINAEGGAARVA